MKELSVFEEKINVRFKNRDLLRESLTHRSYLNEHPDWGVAHNERLEFLGDAVLELAITEELYTKFPHLPEGQLTVFRAALVNYQTLAKAAAGAGMENYILLSKGERGDTSKAREVILANAIEALIGAIYLDQGFAATRRFIEKFILTFLPEIIETRSYRDAKSELQEIAQERFKVTPSYKVLDESGPAHKRTFQIGVFFGNELRAEGTGSSKQEAEIEAAKEALKKLEK